jgi:hypothetical protein
LKRSARYATYIVLAHLLVNIAHGLAHRKLEVGLTPLGSIFVLVVVLLLPLVAMGLVWTSRQKLGLLLLSTSMFGALIFGLYHHFIAAGADHVYAQPQNTWGITFVLTSYLLLITEAIGTYVGIHFLGSKVS